jgi:hypothetical protein
MHVLIMTYKRVDSVQRLLGYIGTHAPRPSSVHVVVSQSCASEDDPAVAAMAAAVQHAASQGGLGSVTHSLTPLLADDTSFSVNRTAHGSKRNALNNLLHGLDYVFTGDGGPGQGQGMRQAQPFVVAGRAPSRAAVTEALVLEDDAALTPDALAYFGFAAQAMARDRHADFATAYTLHRPSLLVGTSDVDALRRMRAGYPDYAGRVVDRLVGTPRSVFKTISWMLSRRGYARLRDAMAGMVAHRPGAAGVAGAAAAAAADDDLRGQLPDVVERDGSPVALRSSHPELAGCPWCHDYCYDHVIEWQLQGRAYLAPWEPRVTQAAGQGMTSTVNAINDVYVGAPRRQGEFLLFSAATSLLRLFYNAGLSGVAPPAREVARLWSARVASGLAAPEAPLVVDPDALVPTSELALMWLTEPVITIALLLATVAGLFFALVLRHRAAERRHVGAGLPRGCCGLRAGPGGGRLPLHSRGRAAGGGHAGAGRGGVAGGTGGAGWLSRAAMPGWLGAKRDKRA